MPWWQIVLIALAAYCILLLICSLISFQGALRRRRPRKKHAPNRLWRNHLPTLQQGMDWFFSQPFESLELERCGFLLRGRYLPRKGSHKTAVLLHGYRGEGRERMVDGRFYYENGFNLFLPDLRSHGSSGGAYIGMGCGDRGDIPAWLALLEERYGPAAFVLDGVSMGAATVLSLSGDSDLPSSVKALVANCAFTSVYEEFDHVLRRLPRLIRRPLLLFSGLWSRLLAGYSFRRETPVEQAARASCPILFLHGEEDTFVPYSMMERLYAAYGGEKTMVSVPDATHALSFITHRDLCERALAEFLQSTGLLSREGPLYFSPAGH